MKNLLLALAFGIAMSGPAVHAADVDVDAFVKRDRFEDIKISPTGEYYAATVPMEDRTTLAILRRSDNKLTAHFGLGKHTHVYGFWWVNDERVVMSVAEKYGALNEPQPDGNLYAISANGARADILAGWKVRNGGTGTHIKGKTEEFVGAELLDRLPGDDRNVLVKIWPPGAEPFTRVDSLDVYTGRRRPVTRVPVRRADFLADNAGVVRFARGANSDNITQLYYRKDDSSEWELIGGQAKGGFDEVPLGFSADNRIAYLQVEKPEGPDAVVAWDTISLTRTEVLRDANVDPHSVIYRPFSREPVGVRFMDGTPRAAFFEPSSREARLQKMLDASFDGDAAVITSQTRDGRLALVATWSDRNPGDFFIFDTAAKKADYILSRREWFDPARMGAMRTLAIAARDGTKLHGYLTLPQGSDGRSLPLVVMPHGGPYGIRDTWGFQTDPQLLAAAGYAVLQVNFRGSGGYGRAFRRAGRQQWGGTMQDDLTDATRWAIDQGVADASRICLVGGSYGAYASLMGLAKEPTLYRCAVGYVGVYDLPAMQKADASEATWMGRWSRDWVGEGERLERVSPNRIVDRIKAPVFLAAGGEDVIAPIEQSRMMERALRKANVPVETLYYPTEGHGFYKDEHRREYYTRLLAFLSRHLGGGVAKTGGAVPTTAGQ